MTVLLSLNCIVSLPYKILKQYRSFSNLLIYQLLSIKWLVALIPSDYFLNKTNSTFKSTYPLIWIITIVVKNIIGYTLIIGGILMLVLPGQGLFTILIGLMLSNYPGKYFIERKFIAVSYTHLTLPTKRIV